MTDTNNVKLKITRGTKFIIRIATIIGAITVIAGGYSFYLNNVWKPNVEILLVDFNKGYAELKFHGRKLILEGDATVLLGGDWGIKFGTKIQDEKLVYTSLNLTKKGMLVDIIKR